jgi:hypothetical protein
MSVVTAEIIKIFEFFYTQAEELQTLEFSCL